jgi:hypothetical protein
MRTPLQRGLVSLLPMTQSDLRKIRSSSERQPTASEIRKIDRTIGSARDWSSRDPPPPGKPGIVCGLQITFAGKWRCLAKVGYTPQANPIISVIGGAAGFRSIPDRIPFWRGADLIDAPIMPISRVGNYIAYAFERCGTLGDKRPSSFTRASQLTSVHCSGFFSCCC